MIKLRLIILLGIAQLSLLAQNQPDWLIGGDIELGGFTVFDETSYDLGLSVQTGYIFQSGIMTGLESAGTFTAESYEMELVPLLRYYYFIGDRHAVYAGARAGYAWGRLYSPFEDRFLAREAWVWGGRLGYLSRLNQTVALDVFIFSNLRSRTTERPNGEWTARQLTNTFGLGIGLQVFL